MRKIMFVGRVGAGKTTLTQALSGERISYHKTQYINHFNVIIDTPGEYAETRMLAHALALYSYEADVIGFLMSAIEPYSLYSPNIVPLVNREVIGIVTKIDHPRANIKQADTWLELAGCKTIFHVNSVSGEGIAEILRHLMEPGDELISELGSVLRDASISRPPILLDSFIRR